MRFLLNWLLTSISIAIATFIVPGIAPFGPTDAWLSFAFVGLFLGVVNSLVKPLITGQLAAGHLPYAGRVPAGGQQLHA